MAAWASVSDTQHRGLCYGPNRAAWPADSCPAGLTAASTGLSASCLKVLWREAGCSYTDSVFTTPGAVREGSLSLFPSLSLALPLCLSVSVSSSLSLFFSLSLPPPPPPLPILSR
jgi:hypothetical protein